MRHRWLLLAAALSGCATNWQPTPAAPAQALHDLGPADVRVRRANGDYVVLRDPAVEGDSLVGWEVPPWDKAGGPARRSLALTDVRQLALRQNDAAGNILLGLLAGTVAFGVMASIALAGMSD